MVKKWNRSLEGAVSLSNDMLPFEDTEKEKTVPQKGAYQSFQIILRQLLFIFPPDPDHSAERQKPSRSSQSAEQAGPSLVRSQIYKLAEFFPK